MSGPLLTGERLELWQPAASDENAMFAIMQDPRTWHYFGSPMSEAEYNTRFFRNAGSWYLHGYGGFIVRLKSSPQPIGNCGIFHTWRGLGEDFDDKPEAGWIIAAEHTGKGLAREAMDLVLDWFDRTHGPREVVCMIHPDNVPSIALSRKLGFVRTRLAEMHSGDPVQLFTRSSG